MATFGSAFAGIGGFELGLETAGWECRWQIENDKFCNKVLKKFWPDVKRYRDIEEVNPKELETVDLICGGFPCQSVSAAGQRRGDKDPRWLWPQLYRVIRGIRPRWVLVENVPGLFSIDSGRLFAGILRDLASLGYDAEWDCIPAAAFGAPHLRYRVFIVAYPQGNRDNRKSRQCGYQNEECQTKRWHTLGRQFNECSPRNGTTETLAHPEGERCKNAQGRRPAVSVLSGGNPPPWGTWPIEPAVGRVANGVPHRMDRLKSLGNAVVPQVVEWIGRRILEYGE